jgi:hypothetical protein
MTDDKLHSRFPHVYAIVRIDLPVNPKNPENNIAVVKVFSSQPDAEAEARRLNEVNKEKECTYILYTTRLAD